MCDINTAFKLLIEETPEMTYSKLGMMIGENPKKLQALFDPDREDRPFQMRHMVPTMAACDDLTPLELLNAHFGLTTFKLTSPDTALNTQAVLTLLGSATDVGGAIASAIDPKSPGGEHLTRDERQMCLNKSLVAMNVLMGIINILQHEE